MTHYQITHLTRYEYTEPVSLCQNVAHLSARNCATQQAEPPLLSISPESAVIEEGIDFFGNPVHYFTIQEPHRDLTVRFECRIRVTSSPPPEPQATPAWETVRDRLRTERTWLDAYQFAFDSRYAAADATYANYAGRSFTAGRPILEAAVDLVHRINAEFVYDPSATNLATPVAEVFEKRRGVCQDFAHLLIACFRSLGLAARYVSGYVATQPPPGKSRLVGADASHAWASLFCSEPGWVDLDPTNDQIPGERHVLLAWGRDYDDVSPLKGVILGGGHHTVKVAVDVIPDEADPQ